MTNQSILSKKFKSREWKLKKKARHEANMATRADLNREKSHTKDRNVAQMKIDEIGKRGESK